MPQLHAWRRNRMDRDEVSILQSTSQASGGDVLFLVSCFEIVAQPIRQNYRHTLVLHASDLPVGRGWSPHIWAILHGEQEIVVSLLEAEDQVDSGDIWCKTSFPVPKHFLYDEINDALFSSELSLMDRGLEMIESGQRPTPQKGDGLKIWPRRHPIDSEIDPESPITREFDKMRTADPMRYPAFFHLHGHKYIVEIRKADDESDHDR